MNHTLPPPMVVCPQSPLGPNHWWEVLPMGTYMCRWCAQFRAKDSQ